MHAAERMSTTRRRACENAKFIRSLQNACRFIYSGREIPGFVHPKKYAARRYGELAARLFEIILQTPGAPLFIVVTTFKGSLEDIKHIWRDTKYRWDAFCTRLGRNDTVPCVEDLPEGAEDDLPEGAEDDVPGREYLPVTETYFKGMPLCLPLNSSNLQDPADRRKVQILMAACPEKLRGHVRRGLCGVRYNLRAGFFDHIRTALSLVQGKCASCTNVLEDVLYAGSTPETRTLSKLPNGAVARAFELVYAHLDSGRDARAIRTAVPTLRTHRPECGERDKLAVSRTLSEYEELYNSKTKVVLPTKCDLGRVAVGCWTLVWRRFIEFLRTHTRRGWWGRSSNGLCVQILYHNNVSTKLRLVPSRMEICGIDGVGGIAHLFFPSTWKNVMDLCYTKVGLDYRMKRLYNSTVYGIKHTFSDEIDAIPKMSKAQLPEGTLYVRSTRHLIGSTCPYPPNDGVCAQAHRMGLLEFIYGGAAWLARQKRDSMFEKSTPRPLKRQKSRPTTDTAPRE